MNGAPNENGQCGYLFQRKLFQKLVIILHEINKGNITPLIKDNIVDFSFSEKQSNNQK